MTRPLAEPRVEVGGPVRARDRSERGEGEVEPRARLPPLQPDVHSPRASLCGGRRGGGGDRCRVVDGKQPIVCAHPTLCDGHLDRGGRLTVDDAAERRLCREVGIPARREGEAVSVVADGRVGCQLESDPALDVLTGGAPCREEVGPKRGVLDEDPRAGQPLVEDHCRLEAAVPRLDHLVIGRNRRARLVHRRALLALCSPRARLRR
mmetsp:Transcript_9874/g.32790  ORF Transcript_9874/g.32790 Transcript_9874/m.32790 type:complete len:207 (-) Transcript_9874:23-643(-)